MPEDFVEKVALLFVGWLLGLLGPIVVDAIRRRRENVLGQAAILTELHELAEMLALAAYAVKADLGTVDRAFLEWIKRDLELHGTTPEVQKHVEHFRTQLSWTDEARLKVAGHLKKKAGKGTVLQHYPVPLLDARVSAMWSFSTTFQRQLLQIRRNVALLDALVDRAQKYHDMTYSKLEGNNYELVVDNQDQACTEYATRAQRVVDLIRSIPSATQ